MKPSERFLAIVFVITESKSCAVTLSESIVFAVAGGMAGAG